MPAHHKHHTLRFTSGNYEAFVRTRKPAGVDDKSAYFVGSGLSSLAAAVFLIRDAHMDGSKITILEQDKLTGGALDGIQEPDRGFVIRGGRELENHYECLWDLFRSIPSLEVPDASVLDEFYWLDRDDPNSSLCRITHNQGQDAQAGKKFTLSAKAQGGVQKMFLANPEDLQMVSIEEFFAASPDFFSSNFWVYWQTMFGWQKWHSALEMKLYLHRFIHHISGLPDMTALKFTRYNQYESFVLPLMKYLLDRGVVFKYETTVKDVDFHFAPNGTKQATKIHITSPDENGEIVPSVIPLTANDVLFMTNGSLVENSDNGDHYTPAKLREDEAAAWELWKRIAKKTPNGEFGNPERFCGKIFASKWQSATATTLDERIPAYIEKICKRNPFKGEIVTGGIVTAKDSNWMLSWTVNRQPHFKNQPEGHIVAWIYGLLVEEEGNFIKKPMQDCTGEEITQEWLYHMGVPVEDIPQLAATGCKTVPTMMPYVTSFFMPRMISDRPAVTPAGALNFAFIGQFAQSETSDVIFTTEYSVRTAMEAVYKLFRVDRGIPEVFNSTYNAHTLIGAMTALRDGEHFALPGVPRIIQNYFCHRLSQWSVIGRMLLHGGLLSIGDGEEVLRERERVARVDAYNARMAAEIAAGGNGHANGNDHANVNDDENGNGNRNGYSEEEVVAGLVPPM